jgi:hypothetical protein
LSLFSLLTREAHASQVDILLPRQCDFVLGPVHLAMSYSAWNASEIEGGDKAAKRRRLNDCYSTLETASHLHSNYTTQDPPSWTTELHYNTTRSDNAKPVPSTCGTESGGHYCHDKDVFEDSKGCSAACCYGMVGCQLFYRSLLRMLTVKL